MIRISGFTGVKILFLGVDFMIFVGIDIAKNTHFASVVDSELNTLVKPFSFSNDQIGFEKVFNVISNFKQSDILIGLEATGIYGDNLISFLFNKGFKIGCINPLQSDSLRSSNIRKTKTDKIDTLLICKCLMLKDYTLITETDIQMIKLKSLCRFKIDVVKSQSKLKCQLVSCIDLVFPECSKVFKDLHCKSSYALFSRYPSAHLISRAREDTIYNIVNKASRGAFGRDKAVDLKNFAKNSIAIKNTSIELQILLLIKQIKMLQEQIDLLDSEISNIMDSLNSVITTIPGIGNWLGAIIISEIGDISKFPSAKKLLAFAGLDPTVKQSGNSNTTNLQISKRGSKALRYAIHRAAFIISFNNDTFHNYYTTKISQGKSHLNAIGHVSHKLTRVIFKLLSTNTVFSD